MEPETQQGTSPAPWHNWHRPLWCICCHSPSRSFCRLLSFRPPWTCMPNLHSSLVVCRHYHHRQVVVFCSRHLNQGRELDHAAFVLLDPKKCVQIPILLSTKIKPDLSPETFPCLSSHAAAASWIGFVPRHCLGRPILQQPPAKQQLLPKISTF